MDEGNAGEGIFRSHMNCWIDMAFRIVSASHKDVEGKLRIEAMAPPAGTNSEESESLALFCGI
jgi:hypothetical protein